MLMKFWALQQAKREKRRYEFKSIKLGNKLPRLEKQITNIQKIYQKKQTQLESQSKMYQSNMEQQMRAQMACMYGGGSYGSFGSSMLGGMAGSIFSQMISKAVEDYNSSPDENKFFEDGKQGKKVASTDASTIEGIINGTLQAANQGLQQIAYAVKSQIGQYMQMQQQMMEQNINNMKMMVEQQKEMQIAQMEEEQEAALLPLNEEQTELELEKTFVQARLDELGERIKNLEQSCAEEAKDHAPKFGLG